MEPALCPNCGARTLRHVSDLNDPRFVRPEREEPGSGWAGWPFVIVGLFAVSAFLGERAGVSKKTFAIVLLAAFVARESLALSTWFLARRRDRVRQAAWYRALLCRTCDEVSDPETARHLPAESASVLWNDPLTRRRDESASQA